MKHTRGAQTIPSSTLFRVCAVYDCVRTQVHIVGLTYKRTRNHISQIISLPPHVPGMHADNLFCGNRTFNVQRTSRYCDEGDHPAHPQVQYSARDGGLKSSSVHFLFSSFVFLFSNWRGIKGARFMFRTLYGVLKWVWGLVGQIFL